MSEVSVSLKLLRNSNKNLLQISISAMPVVEASLDTRSYINTNMLGVASRGPLTSASSTIRFIFLDLTCFVVENVAHSHTCMCF